MALGASSIKVALVAIGMIFHFPDGKGALHLTDKTCTHKEVTKLFDADTPLANGFITGPQAIEGCWFTGDGYVFFTDVEGAAWIPPIPIKDFQKESPQ